MYKMLNSVQNYAWGSPTMLTSLYGWPNPKQLPIAELWMGAHPKSSSLLIDDQQQQHSLRQWIAQDPVAALGEKVARQFAELPFLFKVLCAAQPLSIQVHPDKRAAEVGYAREQAEGIPLNAAIRNYKDSNHKPELIYALTPFHAMNGFRPLAEICQLLQPLIELHPDIKAFVDTPEPQRLKTLFTSLLNLQGMVKSNALAQLTALAAAKSVEPWLTITTIAAYHPDDCGLFSPLLLNVITLKPGEAMFLYAGTPHAYLHGAGLEVMANSDNVLRAGLTSKHIDIPELLDNLQVTPKAAENLYMRPVQEGNEQRFPVPVADFAFSIHQITSEPQLMTQDSAAILFCIEGWQHLQKQEQTVLLTPGESCYIPACESPVQVSGEGRLARVYNC